MLLQRLLTTLQNRIINPALVAALLASLIITLPLCVAADDLDDNNLTGQALPASATDQTLQGRTTDQTLQGAVQSQALQGLIKEEVVSPTRNVEPHQIEDMPMPVIPKLVPANPLAGKEDDNTLKGKAEDQGSTLQGQAEKEGNSNLKPLPVPSPDQDKPLEATVSKQDMNSQNIDPDADNAELMVQWDKWRNRLLWAIQSGVDEFLSNPPPESMQWDPRANAMVSKVPLGIEAWFSCQVTPAHQIMNIKLLHGSGSALYDQAVMAAITQLQGSRILTYPSGSKRNIVTQMAGLKTTQTFQRKYFQFGDTERRQVMN
jgi:hypothetical protein